MSTGVGPVVFRDLSARGLATTPATAVLTVGPASGPLTPGNAGTTFALDARALEATQYALEVGRSVLYGCRIRLPASSRISCHEHAQMLDTQIEVPSKPLNADPVPIVLGERFIGEITTGDLADLVMTATNMTGVARSLRVNPRVRRHGIAALAYRSPPYDPMEHEALIWFDRDSRDLKVRIRRGASEEPKEFILLNFA